MATVSQLVEAVSIVTMIEKKTVNAYARALIDAGELPKSSGRAIAHVRGEHCAKLLLAVAVKPTIKTAAKMIAMYCSLRAETNYGTVSALDVLTDMFGAASAGGFSDADWKDVHVKIYENKLGIDIHLPGDSAKRALLLRLKENGVFSDFEQFFLGPNPFFSRSANISFHAMLFMAQIMKARRPDATPQGEEVVQRLLSIIQTDKPEDAFRRVSAYEGWFEEGEAAQK
jgi:hypothetical protein